MKTYGNLWKPMAIYENPMTSYEKLMKTYGKPMEIYENLWKYNL